MGTKTFVSRAVGAKVQATAARARCGLAPPATGQAAFLFLSHLSLRRRHPCSSHVGLAEGGLIAAHALFLLHHARHPVAREARGNSASRCCSPWIESSRRRSSKRRWRRRMGGSSRAACAKDKGEAAPLKVMPERETPLRCCRLHNTPSACPALRACVRHRAPLPPSLPPLRAYSRSPCALRVYRCPVACFPAKHWSAPAALTFTVHHHHSCPPPTADACIHCHTARLRRSRFHSRRLGLLQKASQKR